MTEWYRNSKWNQAISDNFELKLKRARGNHSKAQYLRIQASYLLDSKKHGEIGEQFMYRLFKEYPNEKFSVIHGYEQLADYHFKNKQFPKSEEEYNVVVDFYKNESRGGTSGLADVKLANLVYETNQKDKFENVYNLITKEFKETDGNLIFNDSKFFYCLTCARLARELNYIEDSKQYAQQAIAFSEIKEPQFNRHKELGIVKASKKEIKELKRIL